MARKGVLKLEIADTPHSREHGLMDRKEMDENEGMLFKFDSPQVLKFWGMKTYIPLDIAFISPEHKIVKIDRIEPFCLKTVGSDTDCIMAIEANQGFFNSRKIKAGDHVRLRKHNKSDIAIFGLAPDEDDINVTLGDLFS